jgi:hypothetical protein
MANVNMYTSGHAPHVSLAYVQASNHCYPHTRLSAHRQSSRRRKIAELLLYKVVIQTNKQKMVPSLQKETRTLMLSSLPQYMCMR